MNEDPQTTPLPLLPLACVECFGIHITAQRRGTPESELPPVNAALLIVNGTSVCADHIQFNSPLLVQP